MPFPIGPRAALCENHSPFNTYARSMVYTQTDVSGLTGWPTLAHGHPQTSRSMQLTLQATFLFRFPEVRPQLAQSQERVCGEAEKQDFRTADDTLPMEGPSLQFSSGRFILSVGHSPRLTNMSNVICPSRTMARVKEFRRYGHKPSVSTHPWDLRDINVLCKVASLHWVCRPGWIIVHFPT